MSAATRKSDTHDERYAHIELYTRKYTHATVFARRPKTGGDWTYAVSLCVYGDTFSRKIGRQAARRRYFRELPFFRVMGEEYTYQKAEMVAQAVAALTAKDW